MAQHVPQGSWVFIDGRPVPGEQARIPVFDRGFLYGDSIYEVTRTVRGEPLFLEEHLLRLAQSAQGIEMALLPLPHIRDAVAQTLGALRAERAYLRIVVTRGAGEIGLDPAFTDEPRLVIIAKQMKPLDPVLYREGARVSVVEWRRNGPGHVPPAVKSGNYLSSVLATQLAGRRGAYEALLCDPSGHVAEGASSNFFWFQQGHLQTPPLFVGILPGITRQVVLDLARSDGFPIDEVLLRAEELAGADEVFLTSSVRGVVPVVRVDQGIIGTGSPGPLTRRIMQRYGERIGDPAPC